MLSNNHFRIYLWSTEFLRTIFDLGKKKYRKIASSDVNNIPKLLKLAIQKNLEELVTIEEALEEKNINSPELLQFWRGLVRDDIGRWEKLRLTGTKYFHYGAQPKPDLSDGDNIELIIYTLQQEKLFLNGLQNGSYHAIKNWIILLHKKQAYKGLGGSIITQKRISTHEHTEVVSTAIIPLAKKYNDPYTPNGVQRVYLPNIDNDGLPMDKWIHPNQVMHYYPDPKYFNDYLSCMGKKLQEFTLKVGKVTTEELLEIIACYYQYAINMHLFEMVNQSLFADHVNSMLSIIGLNRMSQGVMDFAALRLQQENFTKFFIDQVMQGQTTSGENVYG